ncbi:MAG: hypothetical protein IJR88_02600 [Clostridia bacterium]|nr:hypothetical protein [Clostridia bacterium]
MPQDPIATSTVSGNNQTPEERNTSSERSDANDRSKNKFSEIVRGELSSAASNHAGESLAGSFGAATSAAEILGPMRTLFAGIGSIGKNLVGLFKNKQWLKLILAVLLAVAWIVLMILQYNGVNVKALNILTFAQGGVGRSVFGWIGGFFGKTAIAAMLISLFTGGFKALGGGFSSLFKKQNFQLSSLSWLLLGAGFALILYQFFAGNATYMDLMPTVSCALLSIMALGRMGRIGGRLATSLTSRKNAAKTRTAQPEKAGALLSGMTFGFTIGALLCLIPFGYLPVILGGAAFVAGLILALVFGHKKEVAAA